MYKKRFKHKGTNRLKVKRWMEKYHVNTIYIDIKDYFRVNDTNRENDIISQG